MPASLRLSLPFLVLLLSMRLSAVEIGASAPVIADATWIRGGAPPDGTERVLVLFVGFSPAGLQGLRDLARMEERFGTRFAMLAVSHEEAAAIRPLLDRDALPGAFAVATSPSTRDRWMGAERGLPAAFLVGADDTVLWSGLPRDLEGILVRAAEGCLDPAAIRRQRACEAALDTAFTGGDDEALLAAARALLREAPTDERAVEVVTVLARERQDPALRRESFAAIDLDALDRRTACRLARILLAPEQLEQRDPQLAARCLARALRDGPADPETLMLAAQVRYALADLPGAITQAEAAVGAASAADRPRAAALLAWLRSLAAARLGG